MFLKPITCIVVPCYNEENGISIDEYSDFIDLNPKVLICFVNDGSTDDTQDVLQSLQERHSGQIHIISHIKNTGKAEAVRTGINYCNIHFDHLYIGYLDADLSTTLEEFIELQLYLKDGVSFCFGSRITKVGSTITRNTHRFIIGRMIAGVISSILDLNVYDTQCGCKIFKKQLSLVLFEQKFISRWLFDVELFKRMIFLFGREKAIEKMAEVPLKNWIEKGNSKVKFSYFFKMWIDLYLIRRNKKNELSGVYLSKI